MANNELAIFAAMKSDKPSIGKDVGSFDELARALATSQSFESELKRASDYRGLLDALTDSIQSRIRPPLPTLPTFEFPLGREFNRWSETNTLLVDQINTLNDTLRRQTEELRESKASSEADAAKRFELEKTLHSIREKHRLAYVLTRIRPDAHEILLRSPDLQSMLTGGTTYEAYVMSVDVRRSTELMLKARAPDKFAAFLSLMCDSFRSAVVDEFGVFDKFTGDGILAFFPVDFSGDDAGLHTIRAANRCHESFSAIYRSSRGSFQAVLADVGLGIGVDYGRVQLLQVADGLTVVGAPVVYACRLSSSPAGTTMLNQPAFEVIRDRYGRGIELSECTIEIKGEGRVLAYQARLVEALVAQPPGWMA